MPPSRENTERKVRRHFHYMPFGGLLSPSMYIYIYIYILFSSLSRQWTLFATNKLSSSRRTRSKSIELRAICAISRAFVSRDKVAVFQFGRKIAVTRGFLFWNYPRCPRARETPRERILLAARACVTSWRARNTTWRHDACRVPLSRWGESQDYHGNSHPPANDVIENIFATLINARALIISDSDANYQIYSSTRSALQTCF